MSEENIDKDGWRDILGSGAVMKKTIQKGDGICPEFKQITFVHVTGKIKGTGRSHCE